VSALLWALRHPLNQHRRTATLARWAAHNARRRITRGRDVTLTFNGLPLRGPIDHPIINLATYVQGGLDDYDAMTSLTILLEPGRLFIDVGANIGPYSVLAAGLGRCLWADRCGRAVDRPTGLPPPQPSGSSR